ncbi:uncharacterized protein I303_100602 [Kwoniella dejecticola CBS 10117]|uniref:RING-type domain-containing protein n=1 Tax=Kwoniella dejecticola CBS 10117 TaxID=1296121 RepID=A0A1A6AFI5_9TREE|nr:uncharacterized protein I303_00605 [Kwoniella dejecticola CBS 10117]OBR88788.1 hypothetical protein I303_00605 [Kwoniella dejecticola CBS 10117]
MFSSRKGKGKAKEVVFDLEPNLHSEGGSDQEGDETDIERNDRHESDSEDEDEDEENYEAERQRRIRENQLILAGLGIEGSGSNLGIGGSSSSKVRNGKSPPPTGADGQPGSSTTRKKRADIPILDRSGYIISLPPEGQTQTMACLEMPSDRKLKKKILDGEYTDCSRWSIGEARRWKFGFGKGGESVPEGEEEELGGVTKDFRWRRWRGLEKELRREMRQRGELVEMDARPVETVLPEGVSAYSLIPGEACHQCRRKSDKPKMKCRNVNPLCRANFCETCCKRYNYFDFDEESRSFICPLCKDCCNCSNCIRKKNLAHLLGDNKGKILRKSLKYSMGAASQREMDVQTWLEKAVKDISRAPFDLVRIVDFDKDVISPDLPSEIEEDIAERIVVEKPKKLKARKRKVHEATNAAEQSSDAVADGAEKPKAKRGRPKKIVTGGDGGQPSVIKAGPVKDGKLVIKLKIPKPPQADTTNARPPVDREKVKEVDSDGDTVGDWSDNERDRDRASGTGSPLTSLSSNSSDSPTIPARLPFPSQPIYAPYPNTDQYHQNIRGNDTEPLSATPLPEEPNKSTSSATVVHHSSPELEELSPSKKRKRPPPNANIIRAPRRSSMSTSASGPEVEDQTSPAGTMTDGIVIGPRNMTNDPHNQLSAAQTQFSMSSQQQAQASALANYFSAGPPSLSLTGPTPSQLLNEMHNQSNALAWHGGPHTHTHAHAQSMYHGNPYEHHPHPGYQTLYPPSHHLGTSPSPSSFSTLPLPLDYPSSSYFNPGYPSSINPMRMNFGLSAGPPPYSHSPIGRTLALSPDTPIENQFLVSPQPKYRHSNLYLGGQE